VVGACAFSLVVEQIIRSHPDVLVMDSFTTDFRKIAGIESYAPTDNVSELTARINDDGWDSSYKNWLRGNHLGSQDMVFVFSVGGGDAERNISTNLVRALQYAKEVGAPPGASLAQLQPQYLSLPSGFFP
jgi:hypothetical protein